MNCSQRVGCILFPAALSVSLHNNEHSSKQIPQRRLLLARALAALRLPLSLPVLIAAEGVPDGEVSSVVGLLLEFLAAADLHRIIVGGGPPV